MTKHYASASWEGNFRKGTGLYKLESSGYEGAFNTASRFEDNKKLSSPEELIGAAHASCFSMALALALDQAGHSPESIKTQAEVTLSKTDDGFSITHILLKTKGKVAGISKEKFLEIAGEAKKGCPVSKALQVVNIDLEAELL